MNALELIAAINKDFGSVDEFKRRALDLARGHFGSGYLWVYPDDAGHLQMDTKANAMTPLTLNQWPILTCDLWEHAYYIDYRNERAKYLDQFWGRMNWNFVTDRFRTIMKKSDQSLSANEAL